MTSPHNIPSTATGSERAARKSVATKITPGKSALKAIVLALFVISLTAPIITLSARSVYNINARWTFFTGADTDTGNSATIYLPHTWNNDAVGAFYRGVGNYSKDIDIPLAWEGQRVFMRIGGAATVTDVYINSRHAADHYGGNSAFTFEITEILRYGRSNNFRIMVNNSPRTDVLPTAGEENIYGGIFRNVELVVCDSLSVSPATGAGDGVWITTTKLSDNKAEGNVRLELLDAPSAINGTRANVFFIDANEKIVARADAPIGDLSKGTSLSIPFSVSRPRLWQGTADPYLYDVAVTITSPDGTQTDSLTVRTGFRTIAIDSKNNLLINGKPLRLRGVILHRDRMLVGTAVTPFQIEEDVDIIREMGANAVCVAGGQHGGYFYDLCDEAGLVVWNDDPFVGAAYPTDIDYVSTDRFRDNGSQQLSEMIAQLYNHPCVAMWGLFSDIDTRGDDPVPYIRSLNDLAHRLDPSRLTVGSSVRNGNVNFITDLISFHQSFGWDNGSPNSIKVWADQLAKGWPNLRAGLSYSAGASIFHQSEQLQKTDTQSNHHPEGWQTYFHEEYVKSILSSSQFWGIFVGNMFDFGATGYTSGDGKGINNHGLVTFDRKDRKDAFYLYKANWNTTDPFVYIVGKRLDTRSERLQTVKAYSNQREVELFLAGRSQGKQSGTNGIFTWEGVNFRVGVNRLEVRAASPSGTVSDRASITIDLTLSTPDTTGSASSFQ